MSFLSISCEVGSLPIGQDKRYHTTYEDVGFELGFGRAGFYRGHSHLRFIDLIFAPTGIRWCGDHSKEIKKLVVAPARTYLPDLSTGDFVFLKFCPDDGEMTLPDKIYEEMYEQEILAFTNHAHLAFPWYSHPNAERQTMEVILRGANLRVEIGYFRSLIIGR